MSDDSYQRGGDQEGFDTNVYSIIVVKKKYVPKDILNILEQPAEIMPPWDPMFDFVQ